MSPSPLLSLPAELRLRIYEYALAPTGVLTLHSTPNKRFAVTPSSISPALLRTCHQIHHEAEAVLYRENEVTVTVNAHDTCWPTLAENRLPQRVLERLRRFCVVLDATDPFAAKYVDVDFGPFAGLVALRRLRIGLLYVRKVWEDGQPPADTVQPSYHRQERLLELFAELVRRVPETCEIVWGLEKGSQQEALLKANVVGRRLADSQRNEGDVYDRKDELLLRYCHAQGSVFGFLNKDLKEVGPLVPREEQGTLGNKGGDVFSETRAWLEYYK